MGSYSEQLYEEGKEEGKAEGRAEGEAKGEARGKIMGFLDAMYELVRDNILTLKEAAIRAKVPEEEFSTGFAEYIKAASV